jgi:hypothetical protein
MRARERAEPAITRARLGTRKLARAVKESVTAACEQAKLDAHQVRFEAACFR